MSDLTLNVIKAIKDRQSFEEVLIDVAKAFAACDFFKYANWKATVESTFCAQEEQNNFSQTLNVTELVGLLASDWESELDQILNGRLTDYIEQTNYESLVNFADATSIVEVCNELNGGTEIVTEELPMTKHVDLNPQTPIRCMSSVQDSSNILPSSLSNAADTVISQSNIPIAQDLEVHHEFNIDINMVEDDKSDENKFACDICGKKFSTKTLVKRHIKKMHEQRHISVAHQNRVSIPTTTLPQSEYHHTVPRQHLKRRSGEQSYVCGDCQKGFRWPSHLKLHQMTHLDEKPFACGDCQKRFSQSSILKIHQRIHSGEKPYVCGDCQKRFRWKANLKTHQRIHSGEKPYVCGNCHKRFSQRTNLKTHQRIHLGEKPYVCGDCQKTFNRSENLKTHQRIHSVEKPFVCGDCQKTFNRSENLKTHQRIHSGEKPYVCGYCQKTFNWSENLKTHQRIHSGEKPFVCGDCHKTFNRSANLKRHQETHNYVRKRFSCAYC